MADVAHTRPIPVTATADEPDIRERFGLEMSSYEGPTGIVGVLADAATQVGLPSVSCLGGRCRTTRATRPRPRRPWLSCPASEPPRRAIDHGDLEEDARAWERGVNELASGDSDVAEYVESLEEAQDTAELPEASGDAIAKRVRALPAPPRCRRDRAAVVAELPPDAGRAGAGGCPALRDGPRAARRATGDQPGGRIGSAPPPARVAWAHAVHRAPAAPGASTSSARAALTSASDGVRVGRAGRRGAEGGASGRAGPALSSAGRSRYSQSVR